MHKKRHLIIGEYILRRSHYFVYYVKTKFLVFSFSGCTYVYAWGTFKREKAFSWGYKKNNFRPFEGHHMIYIEIINSVIIAELFYDNIGFFVSLIS